MPPCKHDEGGATPLTLTLSSVVQSKAGTWWVLDEGLGTQALVGVDEGVGAQAHWNHRAWEEEWG